MQADWDVEVGGDAPVIDAYWPGYVDLRSSPESVDLLPEARELPGLGQALIRLNGTGSPVWTAKCDLWRPDRDTWDIDELDAWEESAVEALACYVDLLPSSGMHEAGPDAAVCAGRTWSHRLRETPLRSCRADFVVRRAHFRPDEFGFAITAYLTACGATLGEARSGLAKSIEALVEAVSLRACSDDAGTKLQ